MAKLGFEAYRFSISWPRIFPGMLLVIILIDLCVMLHRKMNNDEMRESFGLFSAGTIDNDKNMVRSPQYNICSQHMVNFSQYNIYVTYNGHLFSNPVYHIPIFCEVKMKITGPYRKLVNRELMTGKSVQRRQMAAS